MGYPVSKITAIQPDGKTSTIQRIAFVQAPTDIGQFCHMLQKAWSFDPHESRDWGISGLFGKYALCVNHGSDKSMISLMKHIRTPNGERRLTQKLNCKDDGIYAACCKNYDHYYVG